MGHVEKALNLITLRFLRWVSSAEEFPLEEELAPAGVLAEAFPNFPEELSPVDTI